MAKAPAKKISLADGKGVEDFVQSGVFGKILAAGRGGHAGIAEGEEFTAKAQRERRRKSVTEKLWLVTSHASLLNAFTQLEL